MLFNDYIFTIKNESNVLSLELENNWSYAHIRNDGNNIAYVSIKSNANIVDTSGVLSIPVGTSVCLPIANNKFYVLGKAELQVIMSNAFASPFKLSQKGGGENENLNVKVLGKTDAYRVDPNWAINVNGLAIADDLHTVVYYSVSSGSLIYIKATDDSNECKYVWYTTSDVSSQTTTQLVGEPVTEVTDGLVSVPDGARYIAFSQLKTDIETSVYKVELL